MLLTEIHLLYHSYVIYTCYTTCILQLLQLWWVCTRRCCLPTCSGCHGYHLTHPTESSPATWWRCTTKPTPPNPLSTPSYPPTDSTSTSPVKLVCHLNFTFSVFIEFCFLFLFPFRALRSVHCSGQRCDQWGSGGPSGGGRVHSTSR